MSNNGSSQYSMLINQIDKRKAVEVYNILEQQRAEKIIYDRPSLLMGILFLFLF